MTPSVELPVEPTTLLYRVDGPIATITLNRPERLNTIVPPMPEGRSRLQTWTRTSS